MNGRRLLLAGDHDTCAGIVLELGDYGRGSFSRAGAQLAGDVGGERLDFGGAHRKAMVGFGAGERGTALGGVDAQIGYRGTSARVSHVAGAGGQKIGIEGENDLGIFDAIVRIHGLAKRKLRAGSRSMRTRGFVLMPLGSPECLYPRT